VVLDFENPNTLLFDQLQSFNSIDNTFNMDNEGKLEWSPSTADAQKRRKERIGTSTAKMTLTASSVRVGRSICRWDPKNC
jgi:hypothetical protein